MKEAIPVTQEHIDGGDKTYCGCPIACAVAKRYPDPVAGYTNLWLDRSKATENMFYRISPDVAAWMKRYDLTGQGEPFILILDHSDRTASMVEYS